MHFIILLVTSLWQPLFVEEEGTRIQAAHGTIVKVGNLGYGIVPDSDKGTRYAPTILAESFQKDGLRVIFSGTVGKVPGSRGGRAWGVPLTLSSIEIEPQD